MLFCVFSPSFGFVAVRSSIFCVFVDVANFRGLGFFLLVLYVGLGLWLGIVKSDFVMEYLVLPIYVDLKVLLGIVV